MDILQLLMGFVFLLFGGMISFKTRDNKRVILGLFLILLGINLTIKGLGI